MKDYFERVFRYVAWANRRTLASIRATPAAHSEALPLMAHLLAAEHVWLCRLLGNPPTYPVWPALSFDECVVLASENETGYRDFVGRLDDAMMAAPVRYVTGQGRTLESADFDILTQVMTHGPYHRGQIAKVIGRHGGKAESTDFIIFTWEVTSAEPANAPSQPTQRKSGE